MRQLALLVLLAACAPTEPNPTDHDASGPGSDNTPDQQYKSGTRIQARTLKTADGAEFFAGWWDAERGEECSFRVAADGKTRCMPGGMSVLGYYSDAACTKPLAMTPAITGGACDAQYVLWSTSNGDGCGKTYVTKIYALGAAFSGESYALASTACTKLAIPTGYVAYLVGAEIPPSEFVPTL